MLLFGEQRKKKIVSALNNAKACVSALQAYAVSLAFAAGESSIMDEQSKVMPDGEKKKMLLSRALENIEACKTALQGQGVDNALNSATEATAALQAYIADTTIISLNPEKERSFKPVLEKAEACCESVKQSLLLLEAEQELLRTEEVFASELRAAQACYNVLQTSMAVPVYTYTPKTKQALSGIRLAMKRMYELQGVHLGLMSAIEGFLLRKGIDGGELKDESAIIKQAEKYVLPCFRAFGSKMILFVSAYEHSMGEVAVKKYPPPQFIVNHLMIQKYTKSSGGLQGFLIKPVQYFLKLQLKLQQLERTMPPDDLRRAGALILFQGVSAIQKHINDTVKENDRIKLARKRSWWPSVHSLPGHSGPLGESSSSVCSASVSMPDEAVKKLTQQLEQLDALIADLEAFGLSPAPSPAKRQALAPSTTGGSFSPRYKSMGSSSSEQPDIALSSSDRNDLSVGLSKK